MTFQASLQQLLNGNKAVKSVQVLIMLLVGFSISFSSLSAAQAQQGGGSKASRGVLLLVSEEFEGTDAKNSVNFWWSSPQNPAWTKSDAVMLDVLRRAGVEAVSPKDANISRIYRTANLSMANASALGALLGAQQVIVGQIRYRELAPVQPLNLAGLEADATLHLLAAGSGDVSAMKRFTVERQGFGASLESVLDDMRAQTAQAAGSLIAGTLSKSSSPVGIQTAERLIGLKNIENAAVLADVKAFLTGIESVDAVVERWASEGIIALEVNPGRVDSEDGIEYVLRVLESHNFDGYRLVRNRNASAGGLAEFYVEALMHDSY